MSRIGSRSSSQNQETHGTCDRGTCRESTGTTSSGRRLKGTNYAQHIKVHDRTTGDECRHDGCNAKLANHIVRRRHEKRKHACIGCAVEMDGDALFVHVETCQQAQQVQQTLPPILETCQQAQQVQQTLPPIREAFLELNAPIQYPFEQTSRRYYRERTQYQGTAFERKIRQYYNPNTEKWE